MGIGMKKFNTMGVRWKIRFLRGWGSRKTNIQGEIVKMGGAGTVCRIKGAWRKRGGGCFWAVRLIPQISKMITNNNIKAKFLFSITGFKFHGYMVFKENYRSSHRRCFVRKGILKNFAKFTRKHLRQSPFFK